MEPAVQENQDGTDLLMLQSPLSQMQHHSMLSVGPLSRSWQLIQLIL